MAFGTALALGIGGLAGGISGAMGSQKETSQQAGINVGGPNNTEISGQTRMNQAFGDLTSMINRGPGESDVSSAYGAQQDLAKTFNQYAQGGFLPTSSDLSNANIVAKNMFAPQNQELINNFQEQNYQANRAAGIMGRQGNDPILQAKLAQEQLRQQSMFSANQGMFAQNLALQMPMQRLGFMQQGAGILSGLATQAMTNRQQLAAMGEGIMNNERNWRLLTGTRWGTGKEQSGGGIGGAITGALGGLGAGMKAAPGFNSLFGGAGSNIPSGGFGSDTNAWMKWAKGN